MGSSSRSKEEGVRRWRQRLRGHAGMVVAVIGFVSACLGIYQFAIKSSDSTLSHDESHLLEVMPQKLGENCRSFDPEFGDQYVSLVTASLECAPIDPGPDSVSFHLFTTPRDLELFMRRQVGEIRRNGESCRTDFNYGSPWTDSSGKVMGEVQCASGSRSGLLWSYDDLLVAASAGASVADSPDLHAWWQRQVRFDGGEPPADQRRHLMAILPDAFGSCRPQEILLPMALAGVFCAPGEGISLAGAELFANTEVLTEYIGKQATVDGIGSESCSETPFSYMEYGSAPDYKPILGYLVCQPRDGAQWFEWTADRPRVYAFASRNDNNFVKLFQQWSESLSQIRGVDLADGNT